MGLLSFLKRQSGDAPRGGTPVDAADAVQQARTRARQRLIGAAVLVVAGVIGFPLLFATQPRPLPVDTPIEIARRDGTSTASTVPAPRTAPATAPAVDGASAQRDGPSGIVTESADDAGREIPAPATDERPRDEVPVATPPAAASAAERRAAAAASAAAKPADKPKPVPKPAEKPADKPAAKPPADATRAQALLNGREAAAKPDKTDKPAEGSGRFAVQVGAFAETAAARESRLKVEKLGLKTYTQVVETSAGSRTRVRVGPFPSRAEAEKAAARLKAAGLGAAVLPL